MLHPFPLCYLLMVAPAAVLRLLALVALAVAAPAVVVPTEVLDHTAGTVVRAMAGQLLETASLPPEEVEPLVRRAPESMVAVLVAAVMAARVAMAAMAPVHTAAVAAVAAATAHPVTVAMAATQVPALDRVAALPLAVAAQVTKAAAPRVALVEPEPQS